MADLADLEQRIAQAFARISAGLDRLPDPASRPSADQAEHIAHLQAQLDTERAARSHDHAPLEAKIKPPKWHAFSVRLTKLTLKISACTHPSPSCAKTCA